MFSVEFAGLSETRGELLTGEEWDFLKHDRGFCFTLSAQNQFDLDVEWDDLNIVMISDPLEIFKAMHLMDFNGTDEISAYCHDKMDA